MHVEARPTVTTLEDLQRVARKFERDTLRRYTRLAEQMRRGHNAETAMAFDTLVASARHFVAPGDIRDRQNEDGIDHDVEPGAEIADTPYLMTPYQALRLAVYNEELAFDLFSKIAAETENPAVREQAESLARHQIQYIAELRLQRRRAFRSQAETAVGRVGHARTAKTPQDVYKIRHEVELAILSVLKQEFHGLEGRVPEKTAIALNRLIEEIGTPNDVVWAPANEDESDTQGTFFALRSVLREVEAAFEVFMAIAEAGSSEAIINAAQETEQRYVRLLSLIRSCLDDLIDAQSRAPAS